MKDYINGEARTKVAYLRDMDVLYKDLIDGDNVTKEERTALKHANTWHKKAIAMMKKRLPDDFKKIDRMLKDNVIVMKPKIQEVIDNRSIAITDDRLRDILEILINDNCIGCTATNWKQCHIWELQDDLDVSSMYNEPDGTCQYKLMAEMEKAKNSTYGTIFKEV
jgi:hypothetical protein